MGWRIIKQPNGLFARFSEIVDDFTDYDMTEKDVIELCKMSYNMDDIGSQGKLQRAIDNPQRWQEALEIIEAVHGVNIANKRCQMIIDNASKDYEDDEFTIVNDAFNERRKDSTTMKSSVTLIYYKEYKKYLDRYRLERERSDEEVTPETVGSEVAEQIENFMRQDGFAGKITITIEIGEQQ